MNMPSSFNPSDIIDLDTYPIDQPTSSEYEALMLRCRNDLADRALCSLSGFIRPQAIDPIMEELTPHYGKACVRKDTYNFAHEHEWPDDASAELAAKHPDSVELVSSYAQLRNYQISTDCLLRALYLWEPLTSFVRDVFDVPELYRSQCPHLALSLKIEGEGDIDNWHYDANDGVVSILLSNADEGGDFEYVPYLRSETDERYDRVLDVLSDPDSHAIRRPAAPGDFTLFNGLLSLHRVSPIGRTETPRTIALLCWDQKPNQVYRQSYIDFLDSLPSLETVR